jgi:hypothetical protein
MPEASGRCLPLHNDFAFSRIASPQFRGNANQKAQDAHFKQITLREIDGKEHPSGNVEMYQRPAKQSYPAEIVCNSSNQL